MNLTNSQIRAKARHLLDDNIFGKDWLKSILLIFLMLLIVGSTGGVLFFLSNAFLLPFLIEQFGGISDILLYGIPILLELLELLVLNVFIGPLSVGLSAVHLDLVRGDGKIKIRKFFLGFKDFFDNFQMGMMYLLHIVLWSCLFIIPGIYMSYSYALIFHVKNDHPEYTWKQCFDESEMLMDGNRWKLFKLQLSFIGWALVGALAFFGIGCLWVYPYEAVSIAVFYDELKESRS